MYDSRTKVRVTLSCAMLAAGAALLIGAAVAHGGAADASIRNGGEFRVALVGGTGNIDPSLVDPDAALIALLDTTCARLMAYPDKPPPQGYRLVPEVAARMLVSRDGRTYTFVLRRSFRFSDGTPVRASAFKWAITRTLRLEAAGAENAKLGGALVRVIAGARAVAEGRAQDVTGIKIRNNRLVIKLNERVPSFPGRLTLFCAVPPNLPVDPEGVETFHAAGPYYVAGHVRGRRIVLRRNRFYGGSRPRHVTSFVAEPQASGFADVVDRIREGRADWGWAPSRYLFDPSERLIERYGVNRSQFWVRPGLTLVHYQFNTRRGPFRDNARLRRAANFAIDRFAVRRQLLGVARAASLTDQYLPPGLPAFRDARIYPFKGNLRKARALARGHLRNRKVALYTFNVPPVVAAAHVVERNLESIGLDVEVTELGGDYFGRIQGNPNEPWDIAFAAWAPDHLDPYTYLNELFDGRFIGADLGNLGFNSRTYNGRLRRVARLSGEARNRAYGKLDVELARKAAPTVAIHFANEPTFVSRRVDPRCIVRRPSLDLAVVCLKR